MVNYPAALDSFYGSDFFARKTWVVEVDDREIGRASQNFDRPRSARPAADKSCFIEDRNQPMSS